MSAGSRVRRSKWRTLSLEWKLPLIMTSGIGAALAVLLLSTYFVLRRRAEANARERLAHAVRQVALEVTQALSDRATQFHAAASDPAVRRVLLESRRGGVPAADREAARRVLQQLTPTADTARPVQLWDAHGTELLHIGGDLPADQVPSGSEFAGMPDSSGAVRFTPLQARGGRARFWIIAPILDAGTRVGFLAQPRYVTGEREALTRLRELLLDEASLYMRNADGSAWVAAPGKPVGAPTRRTRTNSGLTAVRQGVGRVFTEEAPVQNAPWYAVLESPVASIMAPRVGETLALLGPLSGLVLSVGALVSLLIGRRIARPLTELTTAAESVSRGTYDRPVTGAPDEIGRLAASFDAMARQVASAGPGIRPDRLEQIFEPFVQGERAFNRPNDGVGLGLAISRQLARGMDGDVSVSSVLGSGSTFTVILPRAPQPVSPVFQPAAVGTATTA